MCKIYKIIYYAYVLCIRMCICIANVARYKCLMCNFTKKITLYKKYNSHIKSAFEIIKGAI